MNLSYQLSQNLDLLRGVEDESKLFELLNRNIDLLTQFFEESSEDETWTSNHLLFMKRLLDQVTLQFLQGTIPMYYAVRCGRVVRNHFNLYESILQRDLRLKTQSEEIRANSLLLSTGSVYFQEVITKQYRGHHESSIDCKNVSVNLLLLVIEYLYTGKIKELWKWNFEEVEELLRVAIKLRVEALSLDCQQAAAKYLTKENVLDKLLYAHREHWYHFRKLCVNYVNQVFTSFRLYDKANEFGIELIKWDQDSLLSFKKLLRIIQRVISAKAFLFDEECFILVNSCSNLMTLDLAGSEEFNANLYLLGRKIENLYLDRCSWLDPERLNDIIAHMPQLKGLSLCHNTQLNYLAWGTLRNLIDLRALNIALCSQVSDQDMNIILQAAHGLQELDLSSCKQISESGFSNIIRGLPALKMFKANQTRITDTNLIELARQCKKLTSVSFSRCLGVSEAGIEFLLKALPEIESLNIEGVEISDNSKKGWKSRYTGIRWSDHEEAQALE